MKKPLRIILQILTLGVLYIPLLGLSLAIAGFIIDILRNIPFSEHVIFQIIFLGIRSIGAPAMSVAMLSAIIITIYKEIYRVSAVVFFVLMCFTAAVYIFTGIIDPESSIWDVVGSILLQLVLLVRGFICIVMVAFRTEKEQV